MSLPSYSGLYCTHKTTFLNTNANKAQIKDYWKTPKEAGLSLLTQAIRTKQTGNFQNGEPNLDRNEHTVLDIVCPESNRAIGEDNLHTLG